MSHIIKKKIYYHDTDAGGVVYYANYLKYLEEARTEYFAQQKVDIRKLAQESMLFVVKKLQIDYKSPARYADEIEVFSEVKRVKNVSLDFYQEIKHKGRLLVAANTQLVCIDSNFSPKVMPEALAKKIK